MPHTEHETSAVANPEAEWFGARRVNPEEKTRLVQSVFASVAWRYDLMNDVMSAGLHRYFKDRLVALMNPQPGQSILDVAGGTGDVARRCARHTQGKARSSSAISTPAMLEAGRAKMTGEHSGYAASNGSRAMPKHCRCPTAASTSIPSPTACAMLRISIRRSAKRRASCGPAGVFTAWNLPPACDAGSSPCSMHIAAW